MGSVGCDDCVAAEGILVKGKNTLEVLPITEGVIGGFNRMLQVGVTPLTVVMSRYRSY